jgi:YggT family protein
VVGPLLSIFTVLFLFRVVLSWFPKYDLNVLPWNIAAWPTEPILKPTRRLIPPVAGVDISPIVWVAFLSFLSEILIGPQGLLSILQKQG